MALKDPSGALAPEGGFKDLGWYSGFQYYGGSFAPTAGAIHSGSPQVGAGQTVSPEVNAQSAAQQGVTPQQFQDYLNKQNQLYGSAGTTGTGTSGTGSFGSGFGATNTPNLQSLYQDLYSKAGISDLEADLSAKEKAYIEATSNINDNPFLSEATRVGRIAKLEQQYNASIANIQKDLVTKKADVEMQLNLQLKQFDLDSQASKQSLDQFNTLLQLGALNGASPESIAQLTMSTGIPSSMIYSAIEANNLKNKNVGVQTFTAENGEVWAVAIDGNTGEMVNKQSLGIIGNVQGGSSTAQFTADVANTQAYNSDTGWKGIFPQLVVKYATSMTLEAIYKAYLATGASQPNEDPAEIKALYEKAKGE